MTRRSDQGGHGARFWVALVAGSLAALLALGAGGYAALHSRWFAASTVTVGGNRHETAAEVVTAAGLDAAPPMISVDPAEIARRVKAAFPWVDTMSVEQHWPHTVAIDVVERVAVATVKTKTGKVELVDRTGQRLGPPGRGQTLPGLQFALKPGSPHIATRYARVLPSEAAPGLIVASTLPPAFRWQVTAVSVDSRGWVTLHMSTPVTFELGPASNLGAKYEAVAAVIKHTTLHVGDVVDVSVPQATTVTGP